jgi:hypothetical protein
MTALRSFCSDLQDPSQSVDPDAGQPSPPADPNADQRSPPADPNAGANGSADPNAPTPPVDPNAGPSPPVDPNAQDPNATTPSVDPNAQDPNAGPSPPVDPNAQDPNAPSPPVDPNAQTPNAQDPNAPSPPVDPNAGPSPPVDPNAQDPNAQDPNAQDPNAQDPNAQDSSAPPVTISSEFPFAEKELGKCNLGEYVDCELKVEGSVKFSSTAASGQEGEAPTNDEVQQDLSKFLDDLWAGAKANAKQEGGISLNGDAKTGSVSLAAGMTLSTKVGSVDLEFQPIQISVLDLDPKKGLSGPKASESATAALPVFKHVVKGVELEVTVEGTVTVELTPDYLAVGKWLAERAAGALAGDLILDGGILVVGIGAIAVAIYEIGFGWQLADMTEAYSKNRQSMTDGFRAGMAGGTAPGDPYGQKGYEFGKENYQQLFDRTKQQNPQATDDQITAALQAKADEATQQVVNSGDIAWKLKTGMWDGLLASGKWLFNAQDAATAYQACGLGDDPRFNTKDANSPQWQAYLKQYPVQSKL